MTKFLSSYDDFVESLFEREMETERALITIKETLSELVSSVMSTAVFWCEVGLDAWVSICWWGVLFENN